MAFLEHDPASGRLRIRFRFGERGFKRSLKTNDRATAEAILQRVEATLADLEVGRLRIPEGPTWAVSLSRMARRPARSNCPRC